ncbi:MAG: hypothetical protein R3A45_09630 [Bdellovibrionota bacterium]
MITTEKQLIELAQELSQAPVFAVDTETTGLDPITSKISWYHLPPYLIQLRIYLLPMPSFRQVKLGNTKTHTGKS